MPFNTVQQHALEGQQPPEASHFQIYKVVCKYRRCPCKFPFDAQIKVANDVWLLSYINHTKAMIPSACHQEKPYLSRPKNTLFAQHKVCSVSEMKHFKRSYALLRMQLLTVPVLFSHPPSPVSVLTDEKYQTVHLKQAFILPVTKMK